MLEGIFKVLFLFIGQLLVRIAYGARGSKARKILKCDKLVTGGSLLWSLMLLAFIGTTIHGICVQPFNPAVLIGCVGIPVIYIAYVFYARSKEKQLVKEACEHLGISEKDFDYWGEDGENLQTQDENERFSRPVAPPPGEWHCSCGRKNANYVSTCVCGQNKNAHKN